MAALMRTQCMRLGLTPSRVRPQSSRVMSTTAEDVDESRKVDSIESTSEPQDPLLSSSPSSSIPSNTATTASNTPPLTTTTGTSTPTPATTTETPPTPKRTKEDFYKKFNLKPSAEVGIKASQREKRRLQALEDKVREEAEAETRTGAERINRLFEKLQLGGGSGMDGASGGSGSSGLSGLSGGQQQAKKGKELWRFLFDEGDLKDTPPSSSSTSASRATSASGTDNGEEKELLDRVPGGSSLFPAVSDHQTTANLSPSTLTSESIKDTTKTTLSGNADRWKDPKSKVAEKDAFKALFSSLFEQKKDSPGQNKVQSLFSNFNRSGLEDSSSRNRTLSAPTSSLFGHPPQDPSSSSTFTSTTFSTDSTLSPSPFTETAVEDPMEVLSRQIKSLAQRAEPIYLERKPKTSSFQVMENTVGPQEWMNQDPTLRKESTLFAAIRDENKVAIRMRKELEEKQGDIVQVREFFEELIRPLDTTTTPQSGTTAAAATAVVRPSGVSLDGLLAQAILAASSTRLDPHVNSATAKSLHPQMGHALVEFTRRQGLTTFIRAVRTESYKALLKSRWDSWKDGQGCLEILKEMQRNGALLDAETKSLILGMKKELLGENRTVGWGLADQMRPVEEMLKIYKSAKEDREQDSMGGSGGRSWARRGDYFSGGSYMGDHGSSSL